MKFTKMHGLGNSYIYVDEFKETLAERVLPDLAMKVANKNTGIGSDGLILIGPSNQADVRMRIFNADGSEAKNCGNGLRCVAKYAYEKGYVKNKRFKVETLGGNVEANVHPDEDGTVLEVTVNMGKPRLNRQDLPLIEGKQEEPMIKQPFMVHDEEWMMTAVSMGNPHAVITVDDIDKAPVETLGPVIEKDPRFPEGVNVEFIEMVSKNELHFRVWERGSGITQACGTGACAAAVAAILEEKANKNETITVHLLGGDLKITWTEEGDLFMRGAAETVCTGEYLIH